MKKTLLVCCLMLGAALSAMAAKKSAATVETPVKQEAPVADTSKAILIIDMQNDFVLPDAPLCVAGALPTVPAIQDMLAYGRSKGWRIIYIIREHRPSGYDVDLPRYPMFLGGKKGYCVPGTKGCEIVDGLTPKEGDFTLVKFRNSAFFGTELDMMLRRMGVKTILLAGTQYPNCVRGTAMDGMAYDYETVIVTDCCSAKTEEVAKANIFDMQNMGIKCISLTEMKAKY